MKIEFKGKVQAVYNMDDTIAYQFIHVPELKRNHVDMIAARKHRKYGYYANSDLFPAMLAGIRKEKFKNGMLRLDAIPAGVTVDTSGFLAKVYWFE